MENPKHKYSLIKEAYPFPNVEEATEEGIVAMGGDLSSGRLISAYTQGMFPWFSEDDPILWWSPDPRFVLFPKDIKVSKSMRPLFNQKKFEVTYNTCFKEVIRQCGSIKRKDQDSTWITEEMLEAYIELHNLGIAQSVEVWSNKKLVGGLYGLKIENIFYGESMFSLIPNSSKFGFISYVQKLKEEGVKLIDCQIYTNHLKSLGAKEIPRREFIDILKDEYFN